MAIHLGIDYGLERTGIAISDPDGRLAFPLATLRLKDYGNRHRLLDGLASLAIDHGAEILVMGLPLHGDGSENLMCRQTRNVAKRLLRRLPLPLYWAPEYLSSAAAEADLREVGLDSKQMKKLLDQQAACHILNSFLSQHYRPGEQT